MEKDLFSFHAFLYGVTFWSRRHVYLFKYILTRVAGRIEGWAIFILLFYRLVPST